MKWRPRTTARNTEFERVMEALGDSEERFRALVETTSDWIWEVDANGDYTYASPKVKDLLGYAPDEIVGKTPFDFMPPDEAAKIRQQFADIAQARRPFERLQNVNLRKDGRRVVLETSGVPILDHDGGFMGHRGIDRDITERIKAQEKLRYLAYHDEAHRPAQPRAVARPPAQGLTETARHGRRVAACAWTCGISRILTTPLGRRDWQPPAPGRGRAVADLRARAIPSRAWAVTIRNNACRRVVARGDVTRVMQKDPRGVRAIAARRRPGTSSVHDVRHQSLSVRRRGRGNAAEERRHRHVSVRASATTTTSITPRL